MDTFTIQVGRLVITSPESLSISGSSGEKTFSINGRLGGVENEMSHLKYIRDQLNSMARMDEHVPFRYSGENRIELNAQNSFIRRLQHKAAAKEGINSVSVGEGLERRVVVEKVW